MVEFIANMDYFVKNYLGIPTLWWMVYLCFPSEILTVRTERTAICMVTNLMSKSKKQYFYFLHLVIEFSKRKGEKNNGL